MSGPPRTPAWIETLNISDQLKAALRAYWIFYLADRAAQLARTESMKAAARVPVAERVTYTDSCAFIREQLA